MRPWPLLLVACADPARQQVTVPLTVEPVAVRDPWTVTSAALDVATVRFREPEPVAWLDVLVPTARAHPGHDPDAGLVGEWAGEATIDLLAGGPIGDAALFTGAVGSAEGVVTGLIVEGTVADGDRTVPFRFEVDGRTDVLGMAADLQIAAPAPGELALALDLHGVLGALDRSPAPGDGTWTLDDPADRNTLVFALAHGSSWTWEAR